MILGSPPPIDVQRELAAMRAELAEIDRFYQVVKGSSAIGLNRGFRSSAGCHNHHGKTRVDLANMVVSLQP